MTDTIPQKAQAITMGTKVALCVVSVLATALVSVTTYAVTMRVELNGVLKENSEIKGQMRGVNDFVATQFLLMRQDVSKIEVGVAEIRGELKYLRSSANRAEARY